MTTIAFLGVGMMGGAVLSAILDAGTDPAVVRGTTLDVRAASSMRERGVAVVDNPTAVAGADVVIVSTKPGDVAAVLDEVAPHLGPGVLVLSLAAGVSTAALESHLPEGTAVIRVMPNTPALVGKGMAGISPGRHATAEQVALAEQLLAATGSVVTVPEKQQDAVVAVSGSGPAYVFYVAEAMIEAGVGLGLSRPVSTELAVQTLYGAATMLRTTGTHPSILREQVTSPGGTTHAALRALDAHAVRAAFDEAMRAAARRSAELGG